MEDRAVKKIWYSRTAVRRHIGTIENLGNDASRSRQRDNPTLTFNIGLWNMRSFIRDWKMTKPEVFYRSSTSPTTSHLLHFISGANQ